jgi:MFS family permease
LQIWGTIFTANIAFNLIFGFVGDSFGWKNTVMWFGGVGCAVTTVTVLLLARAVSWQFLAGDVLRGVMGCLAGRLCSVIGACAIIG